MPEQVFVYGTLKQGQSNYGVIEELVVAVQDGYIRAALYDLGPYPAVLPGESLVYGQLLTFRDLPEALRRMDALEDYYGEADPRNEYVRVVTTAWTLHGHPHPCYCYMYDKPKRLLRFGRCVNERWPD